MIVQQIQFNLHWAKPIGIFAAGGVVGFVARTDVDTEAVLDKVKTMLPSVMVPRELYLMTDFPLNANGKTDRKALIASLG